MTPIRLRPGRSARRFAGSAPGTNSALVEALLDERRLESALRLTDESWALPVVEALTEALSKTGAAPVRGRIVANLAGLYRRYPEWSGQWFGTNPLAGEFPRRTADWSPDGMKQVHRGLSLALADRASSVRFQAIVGMSEVGPAALPQLRAALIKEPDATNQAVLVEALGTLSDPMASPILAAIVRRCGSGRGRPHGGHQGAGASARSPIVASPPGLAL